MGGDGGSKVTCPSGVYWLGSKVHHPLLQEASLRERAELTSEVDKVRREMHLAMTSAHVQCTLVASKHHWCVYNTCIYLGVWSCGGWGYCSISPLPLGQWTEKAKKKQDRCARERERVVLLSCHVSTWLSAQLPPAARGEREAIPREPVSSFQLLSSPHTLTPSHPNTHLMSHQVCL